MSVLLAVPPTWWQRSEWWVCDCLRIGLRLGRFGAHVYRVGMRTSLELDDDLMNEARRYSTTRSTKGLIHEALREFVRVRKRKSLLDLRGRVRFASGYDHKRLRAGS